MKYFFNYLLVLLMITGLVACRADKPESVNSAGTNEPVPMPMTSQEKNAVAGLQWLNDANPAQDAANELQQANSQSRKPKLMAFATRGLSYPGLSKEQLAAISDKTDHKVAEGSGDVIYGPVHREMRKKLYAYVATYNQAIFAAVQ